MKKIFKPAEQEDAVYYSDFTGECFGQYEPQATLLMDFNYGSKYDGGKFTLHLTDEDAELILKFVKTKFSEDYRKTLKKELEKQQTNVNDAIDARDYLQSDLYTCSCNLLQFLLK
jgi:hypothetical protein